MSVTIHIAGTRVHVGPYLRQRCAWCGATLIHHDLRRVAVPTDDPGPPPTWPPGDLVALDGALTYFVAHIDGDDLPEGACARIDPEVTR